VLVTDNSQLVSVFYSAERRLIFTIDSDYMMKSWSIDSGSLEDTLLIKKEKSLDQIMNKNLNMTTANSAHLELAINNPSDPAIVCLNHDDGNITVNNLNSGSILFKLNQSNTAYELSSMRFLQGSSNLYLCATTPEGNVMFFTKPLPSSVYNPK